MDKRIYFEIGEKLFLPKMQDICNTAHFEVADVFSGGMGACYKIVDENNNPYALKITHSDLMLDASLYSRYIDECKKMAFIFCM